MHAFPPVSGGGKSISGARRALSGFSQAPLRYAGRARPGVLRNLRRHAFRGAAENRQAPGNASRQLLGALAEAMPTARRSLNWVAEEFVFLGD